MKEYDTILIKIYNKNLKAYDIFEYIDDITEYFIGQHGLSLKEDIAIVYEENTKFVDRYEGIL